MTDVDGDNIKMNLKDRGWSVEIELIWLSGKHL
jgi:hypothetical protein